MSDPRFKPVELPPHEPVPPPVPWFWPGGICGYALWLVGLGLAALALHYIAWPVAVLWWVGIVLGGLGISGAVACAVFGLRVMERPKS